MRIQLIDVDGHNFPNLPLMKISAWHKKKGDSVEWYDPLTAWINPPDRVYMSKVFTFTPDYPHPVCGSEVIKGGTGYEYPSGGEPLPSEIEHIYPDYSLYPDLCKDTAYANDLKTIQDRKENGMLTRNKKLKDYGIPEEDIEKLNTMLKDFPAEYGYLLSSAALSACPKNTVIADMVIENILHRKSYRKISKERYIPMNPKDFYGYRRKTVAVLYERMRLLGVWEE